MTDQRNGTNYYEILEVAVDASQAEIHRAYQQAKATYSQDNPALYSMFSPEEARELSRMIEEAYSVLCNQSLRKTYDETLMRKSNSGASAAPAQQSMSAAASASVSQPVPSQEVSSGRLPDGSEFVVRKRESSKPNLPPGMGRTAFGTYKVDAAFDAEIAAETEFDGGTLQKVRTYKSLTLDQLSEATRISRTYLAAVEANDYKNLPAAVFVRGFVVQMSRVLGLDDQKVANAYMKKFKAGGGK
jgi:curved DNA-binding protein CbpA